MEQICADLAAEHDALDELVDGLPPEAWNLETPAAGWLVRDQISHLGFYDRAAVLAATDAEAFTSSVAELLRAASDQRDLSVEPGRALVPAALLSWWRDSRAELLAVLHSLEPRTRLPWYGPPMSARSFATARLMETWAHGQDVADALGVEHQATDRLRHVAHLGVQTRDFAYANRGLEPPTEPVYVGLSLPSGEPWTAGDAGSASRVTGPALDFCLVVTQRRHPDDTALVAEGFAAREWLGLAQTFAGPPGPGRPARRPA